MARTKALWGVAPFGAVAATCAILVSYPIAAGGGEPEGQPERITAPDRTVELGGGADTISSSGDYLFAQVIGQSRVVSMDWARKQEPLFTPFLDPQYAVVQFDGRFLGCYQGVVDWLLHSRYGREPEDFELAAHRRQQEVLDSEPYLEGYRKKDDFLWFLRERHSTEVKTVDTVDSKWCVYLMQVDPSGRYCGIQMILRRSDLQCFNRLGIYSAKDGKVVWVGETSGKDDETRPRACTVAVARDGSRLAAVGLNGRGGWIACGDVVQQKIAWEQRHMHNTAAFYGADFSVDGKVLYVGGTIGVLYGFDAVTGKQVTSWQLKDRIEQIASSPDGKWIAAGLADLDGTVCLVDPKTGTVGREIVTGSCHINGLAFSPDSKLLAATGVRSTQIKIYRLDGESSGPSQTTRPAEDKRGEEPRENAPSYGEPGEEKNGPTNGLKGSNGKE